MAEPADGGKNILQTAGEVVDNISVEIGVRFLEHFSEQLYSSPHKAFEELVSNSWDAGAKSVFVEFPDDLNDADAAIWVLDDGASMDAGGLHDLWKVAYSPKENEREAYGRPVIGKFGIGKLATYVLANKLTFICKASDGVIRIVTMDYSAINTDGSQLIEKLSLPLRQISMTEVEQILSEDVTGERMLDLIQSNVPAPDRLEWEDEYRSDSLDPPIHPFPARMAPDLALERVQKLDHGSVVLDPMAGSGTVLRQAAKSGCEAIGFDMDPLAVLMSRVATTPCEIERLDRLAENIAAKASSLDGRKIHLEWIDEDPETRDFVKFWFAPMQRLALRKLTTILFEDAVFKEQQAERDALLLAMSRIIVTKEQRASLARDTSRSRPHKVADVNDFDVFGEFVRSAKRLKKILSDEPPMGPVSVNIGDARSMTGVSDETVDAVITSPPYLNAIDYLRGHKMSLVWMGYSVSELRNIRSNSVGAERSPDADEENKIFGSIVESIADIAVLPRRYQGMIRRYAQDLYALMREVTRVLRRDGQATFVVGNSCLQGVFVQNSVGIAKAAEINGLHLIEESERDLPASSRSLPILDDAENSLSKRMRTESVLVFERRAA